MCDQKRIKRYAEAKCDSLIWCSYRQSPNKNGFDYLFDAFSAPFDKRHFVFSVPFWNCAANFTQLKGRNGFYLPDTNTQVTITIKSLKMNQMLAPNVVEPSQKQRKTPESLGDC